MQRIEGCTAPPNATAYRAPTRRPARAYLRQLPAQARVTDNRASNIAKTSRLDFRKPVRFPPRLGREANDGGHPRLSAASAFRVV